MLCHVKWDFILSKTKQITRIKVSYFSGNLYWNVLEDIIGRASKIFFVVTTFSPAQSFAFIYYFCLYIYVNKREFFLLVALFTVIIFSRQLSFVDGICWVSSDTAKPHVTVWTLDRHSDNIEQEWGLWCLQTNVRPCKWAVINEWWIWNKNV